MAHIVSCMLDDADMLEAAAEEVDFSLLLNNYIAKAVTPQTSIESLSTTTSSSPSSEKQPFAWRMHQPERKYQLFPKDKQSANAASGKALDPEQAFAHAMGQNGEKNEKSTVGSGLRLRMKEHNLIRRRKVSVPELGPMTTVQEVAMDSPTIPGYVPNRPTMHERSVSAPGSSWKHPHLVDFMILPHDRIPEEMSESSPTKIPSVQPRQPLSPRTLAPLVIPNQASPAPYLTQQISLNRLRSGSTPVETRSARTDDSPKSKTPYTPLSAATSNMTSSTLPTPISAQIESRSSPRPWERSNNYVVTTPKEGTSEASTTPRAEPLEPRSASSMSHRRNHSETGSIMERGRPRKRSETSMGFSGPKRIADRRSKSAERRAFEQLPKGWKASEAVKMLTPLEATALQKQALQQAARFEILRKEDVEILSRELRQLDERTEYLRRTYTSLRAGRRNLHTRICQYLRSPRTAKFSHDSMLKQQEALAELDTSIDDWVTKLEQAENRRTRVRQKLLEHVAAAATLPGTGTGADLNCVSETLQHAMGMRPPTATGSISTPPRSPTKAIYANNLSSSPSPQRVVAQVPSTIIEQPVSEKTAVGLGLGLGLTTTVGAKDPSSPIALRRAETIRIYANNDVYTLLAEVENEINKISCVDMSPVKAMPVSSNKDIKERKHLQRAHSHEALTGAGCKKLSTSPRSLNSGDDKSTTGSTTSTIDSPSQPYTPPTDVSGEIFLTSAVFRPEKSVLTI